MSFRHGGWRHDRDRIIHAMQTHLEIPERRLNAFLACGSGAYVEFRDIGIEHKTREYRLRSTHCRDRFCLPCANARAAIIRENLLLHMAKRKNLKLLTLTLKATDQPLSTTLDRLYAHFTDLRDRAFWKKLVAGGAGIVEAKIGKDGQHWHVHWHVIIEAKFVPHALLKKAWQEITGDSHIVDIRPMTGLGGGVQYVTKYVTKAADAQVIRSPRHLAEALTAFNGRRLVVTFGTWRGIQLSERADNGETQEQKDAWRTLGRLDDLWEKYRQGDADARAIIPKLWRPNTINRAANPPPADPDLPF